MADTSHSDNYPVPPPRLHPRVGQRYRHLNGSECYCVGTTKVQDGTEVVLLEPLGPNCSHDHHEGDWCSVDRFRQDLQVGTYTVAPMRVDETLARDRYESGIVAVSWQERTELTVHEVNEVARGLVAKNTPSGRALIVQFHELSEYDIPKVKVGARLWVVTALETDRHGGRQHCRRIIFEELAP